MFYIRGDGERRETVGDAPSDGDGRCHLSSFLVALELGGLGLVSATNKMTEKGAGNARTKRGRHTTVDTPHKAKPQQRIAESSGRTCTSSLPQAHTFPRTTKAITMHQERFLSCVSAAPARSRCGRESPGRAGILR